ncbi:hypothetical protein QTI33_32235 [Variovorax sp. J22P271]|uniref:hypothetical protein n=1 Tax=Variovorax davisae TaxID=3053515 RepID=UPI002575B393|nr:hypothetical protein [Variovorax sp. J22P271]MDM0036843.1 hypothetical protein [Variovorax sp. J22P271]
MTTTLKNRAADLFAGLAVAFALAVTHDPASACSMPSPVQSTPAAQQFMVSVVLQREDSRATIKLVHAQVAAHEKKEAMSRTLRQVKAQYPGYAVLDVIATALQVRPEACAARPGLNA